MPHLHNNTVWVVTEEELVPDFYNCLKSLQTQITRDKDKEGYGLKKVQIGGNGRKLLVAYDSLPYHAQNQIGDPRKHAHVLEQFYTTNQEAIRFYSNFKLNNGEYLQLKHQEEYITNASVLAACVLLKQSRLNLWKSLKRSSFKGLMASIVKDAASYNVALQAKHGVTHTLQSSERWFKDTFKNFETQVDGWDFNYQTLVSKKLCNANAKKVTDETVALLNNMFAGGGKKPTRTQVSRQYDAFLAGYLEVAKNDGTGECYMPSEFKPLSDNTIISYLGSWQERIGSYTRRGGDRQKLMAQFKPHHSLTKPTFAGSIISIDDRQPPFEYEKGKRAWFYNGIDLASEAFVGWVYGKSKEGIIVDFYRQLVRNYAQWGYNMPYELECEMSLNSSFTKTFLRNGAMFSHVRIEANNARGKRIEAFYRPLRYQLEKERVGWLARPFAASESNQASAAQVPVLPYQQIIDGCLYDIQTWNNMPHSVHTSKSRWEVFTEMQHPNLAPTNYKSFLPHLGYKTSTSCHTGIMHLQGGEYLLGDDNEIYTGEKLINLMKQVEGRKIDVYWLDDNEGNVLKALVYIGDRCVCEALAKPVYNRALLERSPADEKARNVMSAYVATIDAYMRHKAASIEKVVIIDNRNLTLNNKFVMPGIKTTVDPITQAPALAYTAADDEDEAIYIPTTSTTKSLIDRY